MALSLSSRICAASLSSVRVSGTSTADVSFVLSKDAALPVMHVNDNVVELTFGDTELDESTGAPAELTSPHTLIRRIGTFAVNKNTVKSRIVVNGTTEDLKQRIHLTREGGSVNLSIDFPKGANSTAQLLKEEEMPISIASVTAKPISATPSGAQLAIVLFVFILAGAATYFFAKFLKQRGQIKGTRKYLVEQLSYCPVGNKAGVSLLKIGNEFILVGVTAQNVSMLSNLPKLQEQYDGEVSLERKDFKVAVDEEFSRLNKYQPSARVSS